MTVFPVGAGDTAALIAAINAANDESANPGADTINLTQSTYGFTSFDNAYYGPNALPAITSNINISGNGATLQRGLLLTPDFRFFYVAGNGGTGAGSGLSAGALTLTNMTLDNGRAVGGVGVDGGGGGLGAGGAIYNQGGLSLNGVTVINNTAQGGNGGNAVLSLSGGGGGMGGSGGTGGSGFGGGGAGLGGAIFNDGGTATLINSTFTQNTASGGTGFNAGQGLGGAIFSRNGSIEFLNVTVSANTAGEGRGLYLLGDGDTALANINNSIFGQADDTISDVEIELINGGGFNIATSNNNLIRKTRVVFGIANVSTADPKLNDLANNGGPTQTFLPKSDSPAINAGRDDVAMLPTDQRGLSRFSGTIDIGSVEVQSAQAGTTLSIADVGTTEGNSGTKQLVFKVTLGKVSSDVVTVKYKSSNKTAGEGDYNAVSGTLTFAPGQTSRTISVTIKGDTKKESDETFRMTLSGAVNATLGDAEELGTIRNDD